MSRVFRLLLVVVALSAFEPAVAGQKKPPPVTIRLHGEGNAREGESFVTEVELTSPQRKIVIRKVPVLNEKDIKAFLPFPGHDGMVGAYFRLDAHGSNKLLQFTTEAKGQVAVILVNGRVAAAARVDRTVSDGILFVPGGILPNEIAMLQTRFPIIGREDEFRETSKMPKKEPKPPGT